MLAITISWIAISVVFLSMGDILVSLYNRLCKQNEQYGLTDTFLLGMCFTLIPLSITSFWLPSNHYVLLALLVTCVVYWIIRKNHFLVIIRKVRSSFTHLSPLQSAIFIIPIISLMIAIIWQVGVFDSLLYHQQNIRWNEEFAVVPGLGNIEHRYSFNSNYLLLSAIFSLRAIFGEGVYSLQVLVLIAVICWTIKEIIQSGYEIKRILLLLIITGYIFTFGYSLAATSTDAIPNIVSLYLIAKLLLYPDSPGYKKLFFVIIPIALFTFKLTIIPLGLISLYILVRLVRNKEYRTALLLAFIPAVILGLWFIRNVITSGYLIFPVHEIDIFTVDWKLPAFVAIEEKDFIFSCGIRALNDVIWQIVHPELNSFDGIYRWGMNLIFIAPTLLSPLVVVYSLIKKKYLHKNIYFVYIILLAVIGLWYWGGPDPRFIGGILFAVIYYICYLLFSTREEKIYPKTGTILTAAFALLMGYWAVSRSIKFYNMFDLKTPKTNSRPVSDILIRQYPYRELLKSLTLYTDEFLPYKLDNGATIYISKSPEIPDGRFVCFESPFPCTVLQADAPGKYQDISSVTTRGKSLQDGFRPK
ncbi:LIC_10190 family membrane protein [Dysgonomonas gadei]|uniref:DUF8201 domain-containing protein n=1 Tax=Dysgonomonas gadei ATCC BAA-286 TaxID=742766 RepID=F5J114_9BACT|nr:hypothetical protein [Dysgonomonas gadei]EGK00757.1 hypothetical protein HMPREF9455_03031 [Dysgonomonas gadei ATCC BAA-286]